MEEEQRYVKNEISAIFRISQVKYKCRKEE